MDASNSRQLSVQGRRGGDPTTENEEPGHESKHQNERVWLVAALWLAVLLLTIHSAAAQSTDTTTTVIRNGPGFTPWAILISALFGAVTAIVVVAKQRITAHKQAAIRFLVLLKTDGDYKQDEELFAALAKQNNLSKILVATTPAELKDRLAVLNYLNIFEVLCVAIRQHVIDENVCKAIIGDSLVKRWKDAQDLILELRKKTKDDEFFEHFEAVKNSWHANPKVVEQGQLLRIWQEIGRL